MSADCPICGAAGTFAVKRRQLKSGRIVEPWVCSRCGHQRYSNIQSGAAAPAGEQLAAEQLAAPPPDSEPELR